MSDLDKTIAAMTSNDPVIRPMQVWETTPATGEGRKVRVLAKHPEPYSNPDGLVPSQVMWVCRDETRSPVMDLFVIPEINLRHIFELVEDPMEIWSAEEREATEEVIAPYTVLVEQGPDQAASTVTFKTSADIDRMARDFYAALKVLEGIAHFAGGIAGDEAMTYLKQVGVWSEQVQ